jgi:hypothetical protein
LVPKNQLSDLTKKHPHRSGQGVQDLFNEAADLRVVDKENLLKTQGLRDIEVGA